MIHIKTFEDFASVNETENLSSYDSKDPKQEKAFDSIEGFVKSYMQDQMIDKKVMSSILKELAEEVVIGG